MQKDDISTAAFIKLLIHDWDGIKDKLSLAEMAVLSHALSDSVSFFLRPDNLHHLEECDSLGAHLEDAVRVLREFIARVRRSSMQPHTKSSMLDERHD